MEDIDQTRSRPIYEQAIYQDLSWLGLDWPRPVMRQSERLPIYRRALEQLASHGLCYPCQCSRKDIEAALSAPQEGGLAPSGPDGAVYPGTCRDRAFTDATRDDAIRLNVTKAVKWLGGANIVNALAWQEIGSGQPVLHHLNARDLIQSCGDVVLARRDIGTSYHLSVVVDDAEQRISHVTRGEDMAAATQIHRLLQALLRLPTPIYRHHRLIRDADGKRLAKRDDARTIRRYREDGASPEDIKRLIGL